MCAGVSGITHTSVSIRCVVAGGAIHARVGRAQICFKIRTVALDNAVLKHAIIQRIGKRSLYGGLAHKRE